MKNKEVKGLIAVIISILLVGGIVSILKRIPTNKPSESTSTPIQNTSSVVETSSTESGPKKFLNYQVQDFTNFGEDIEYEVLSSGSSIASNNITITTPSPFKIVFKNYTFDKVIINKGIANQIKINGVSDDSQNGIYLLSEKTDTLEITCAFSGYNLTSLELSTQALEK